MHHTWRLLNESNDYAKPKAARPEPNVIVRLCDISSNMGAPLTDPSNALFAEIINKWFTLTQRIYIWNYVVDFGNCERASARPRVLRLTHRVPSSANCGNAMLYAASYRMLVLTTPIVNRRAELPKLLCSRPEYSVLRSTWGQGHLRRGPRGRSYYRR